MEDTLAQQQQSFSKKLAKIQKANNELNELEKKMNMHFQANKTTHDQRPINLFDDNLFDDFDKFKHTEKRIDDPEPRYTNITHKPFISGATMDIEREMERSEKKYGHVMMTENIYSKEKKKESFKLFPKPKSQMRQQSVPTISNQATINFDNNTQLEHNQPNIQQNYKIPPKPTQQQPKTINQESRKKSHHAFLNQLESMQQLMKQKMASKENKLRQLEQQIMNENQERVYLYKVNVRLEEELKFLEDEKKTLKIQNPMLGYQIKKMESDIEKMKEEIAKKKKEKKQLLREEQTLKDGYKVVIENCKGLASKQVGKYTNLNNENNAESRQKRVNNENQRVLKKLMGDLDKLKCLVQERVKETSSSKTVKRRVIKSFKA